MPVAPEGLPWRNQRVRCDEAGRPVEPGGLPVEPAALRRPDAAELAFALERYETFRAAADSAGELVARPREEPAVDDSFPSGKWAVLSRLVARVVATKGPIEPFGANEITLEIEERWGDRFKRRVDPRSVAAKLRRMARRGHIHQLRAGRAFHEALYSRTPAPPGG